MVVARIVTRYIVAVMRDPVHPGEVLRQDVLAKLGLGVGEAAERLGISRVALSRVLHGHARVTPNLAVRLEAAGVSTAHEWLSMQTAYDLAAETSRSAPTVEPLDPEVAPASPIASTESIEGESRTPNATAGVDWRLLRESTLAAMSPAERAEYDAAGAEADLALDLAQMVYNVRTAAGLSQTELAHRIGTNQDVIDEIEGGGQIPTIATLVKVARATGHALQINIPAV